MANGAGKYSWGIPAGVAFAVAGALYTQGVMQGSGDASLKDAEESIVEVRKEVRQLEQKVSTLEGRINNLERTQDVLEYRIRQEGEP